MRTIISWQNEQRSFIFKRNADRFIQALVNRGHEIVNKYTSLDGTVTIIVR